MEILSGLDFTVLREVWGTKEGQHFGQLVVSAGESGAEESAVVAVLLEDAATTALAAVVFNADMTVKRWEVGPKASSEGMGRTLLPCPDLDGDGVPEVGISFPWAEKDHRKVGRYSLCSGKSGEPLFEFWGSGELEMFGTSACVLVSADAADRFMLVIGSPRFEKDGNPLGKVQVFGVPSRRLVHEQVGTTVGGNYGLSLAPLVGTSSSNEAEGATFAVASSRLPEAQVGKGDFIARGGYVEDVRTGGGTPAIAVEGLQPWGMLGRFMARSEVGDLLLIGSPGSFETPSQRDLKSKSYLCVVPGRSAVRQCRVFTSQGEASPDDVGRFVRIH